jgi:hypothetical protein
MKRKCRQISTILAGIAVLTYTVPTQVSPVAAAQKLSCQDNPEIRVLVQGAWYEPDHRAAFVIFRGQPVVAACYLINELRVVPEIWIRGGEQDNHPKTMHVIWALRALRYITGGLRFKGKTKYRLNESNEIESNRKQLLRPEQGEVPFFAVWMSRDSLAIAPRDAQIAVINKWIDWYAKKGADFKYTPAEHVDDWYF